MEWRYMKTFFLIIATLIIIPYLPGLVIMAFLYYFMFGILRDMFSSHGNSSSGGGSIDDYDHDASDHWHGTGNPYI